MSSMNWPVIVQFLVICGLYMFDLASDWNMFASLTNDINFYADEQAAAESAMMQRCDCFCDPVTFRCNSGETTNGTLRVCEAEALWANSSAADVPFLCDVPDFAANTNFDSGVCTHSFRTARGSKLLGELRRIRWANLGINCVITPLVIGYLYWLIRKKPISEEIRDAELEVERISQLEDAQEHKCYNCFTTLSHKERFCPTCGAKQDGFTQDTHQGKRMRLFFKRFIGVMHLRMIFLVFEDLPQLLLLIRYIVIVDSAGGLKCRACAFDGDACTYEEPSIQSTVIISAFGTLASVIVFILQMALVSYKNHRIRKRVPQAQRVHLCGVTGVFAAILLLSIVVAPVMFTIASTSARDILAINRMEVTILYVVAVIVTLPLLFFVYMLVIFVIEEFGYDSGNLAPLCSDDDWCCCTSGGDSTEGCCDCDSLEGCCCC